MVKIYKQPFAHGGDTIAIPDASQPDGKVSSTDGWTPDYQLPKTDPNYKPVGRQEMNGVFKEVTEALGQVQVQGAATWSVDGAPFPINAQVYHNGKQWFALRPNSVEPVEGEDWTEFSAAAINNKLDKSAVVQSTGASTTDIMSQKAVSDALNDQTDFTIIYPNGGTEESPANVSINTRYVEANPFPGNHIICEAEILVSGKWGVTGFSYIGSSAGSGVSASEYDGGIVVQTGNNALTAASTLVGNPFGVSSQINTASPCRVKVWKVKGAIA